MVKAGTFKKERIISEDADLMQKTFEFAMDNRGNYLEDC